MTATHSARAQTAEPTRRTGVGKAAKKPALAVVGPAALERRRQRRKARLMMATAVVIVAVALVAVAGGQALVAARQVGLDTAEQTLSQDVTRNQNLQLSRANLQSPARVLQIAEQRYGMVIPKSVTYLAPIDPGRTVIAAADKRAR